MATNARSRPNQKGTDEEEKSVDNPNGCEGPGVILKGVVKGGPDDATPEQRLEAARLWSRRYTFDEFEDSKKGRKRRKRTYQAVWTDVLDSRSALDDWGGAE